MKIHPLEKIFKIVTVKICNILGRQPPSKILTMPRIPRNSQLQISAAFT
jgi:hypothetical protein